MARARNIKPRFFSNETLGALAPLARLLFIGMWCYADREGRLEDRPARLKTEILPYDKCDIDKLAQCLHDARMVHRYIVDGQQYIQIINFSRHQNPHIHEQPSIIPAPDKHDTSTVVAGPLTSSLIPSYLLPIKTLFANANGDWDKFWETYPRKTAKQTALKAWKRIKATEIPAIMTAVETQKTSEQWQRGIIPHPATWLKQRRWEDEASRADNGIHLGQCMWNLNGDRGTMPRCPQPGVEERDRLIYCKKHQHLHGEKMR